MARTENDYEWLNTCIKAQAARIKQLEQMVINLGGDPHKK